jgi:alpha-glucosidase
MSTQPAPGKEPWWMSGVLYQIYPRSFADSNGDGNGDIQGIIDHLDHLEWLGIDGIWLSPVTVSPNADWGYDVADFCAIQPDLGTMEEFDLLIDCARQRDIRVLLDLVPNHTSDQHPWFLDSRSSLAAQQRDWYVWADARADGAVPNNWVSSFGGPAWTLDPATGQYYLHNHLVEQPDLNWWNEDVRKAFDDILEFWIARGVAGFRIDVCNIIIKDAHLRDNPPATEEDDFEAQLFGQRSVYNGNRPEVHQVIQRWRRLAESHDESRVLIGETPVKIDVLADYYGDGADELHLAFNFPFISSTFDAAMRTIVEETETLLPPGAWPAWTGSNHDMSRFATRWANDDPFKARAAIMMLLSLRGTPVLYQGDEIGLGDTEVAHEDMRDPLGVLYWPAYAGRDAMRTPMQWRDTEGGGFCAPGVSPWLPFGDVKACNVEDQHKDPGSMLVLTRDLISLRRHTPDLRTGQYASVGAPQGIWAWRRGEDVLVALNLGDHDAAFEGFSGQILIGTDRRRDAESFSGSVPIRAWEGLVASLRTKGERCKTLRP